MKQFSLLAVGLGLILPSSFISCLIIAAYETTIEHTPLRVALEDYWTGPQSQFTHAGVVDMVGNSSIDLAGNAETQALRNYATNKDLRIIYTIVEVFYRIVANRQNVASAQDLRGKKIGTMLNTSAQYFIQQLLANEGLSETDYTIVAGDLCNAEPCGNGTLPYMLVNGEISAIGYWEPTIELAARELGDDAIIFEDPSAYREIYNLHTTTEKLQDPTTRAEIVDFVRALHQAQHLYTTDPESVLPRITNATDVPEDILEAVWHDHNWNTTLTPNMLSILVKEDQWLAGLMGRDPMTEEELAPLIDSSILDEALGLHNGTGPCSRHSRSAKRQS